ncbi:hypothetical protein ACLOJK_017568 [Asimina triloba]
MNGKMQTEESQSDLSSSLTLQYGCRPKIQTIFDSIGDKWGKCVVSVFVCGPLSLRTSVAAECRSNGTVYRFINHSFELHQEVNMGNTSDGTENLFESAYLKCKSNRHMSSALHMITLHLSIAEEKKKKNSMTNKWHDFAMGGGRCVSFLEEEVSELEGERSCIGSVFGQVAGSDEDQKDANEAWSVDIALHDLLAAKDGEMERVCMVQRRLEAFEVSIERLEDGLESIFSATRDILLQMKEHMQSLRSALRRKGECTIIRSSINEYISSMKRVKKDINKCLQMLKEMDDNNKRNISDQQMSTVGMLLRETRVTTISFLQTNLSLLSASRSNPKISSKWSLVSRLMHKGQVARSDEDQKYANEAWCVDISLHDLLVAKDGEMERVHMVQRRLEAFQVSIERLEGGLESMFRFLIQNRVSLLNIFSQ